MKLLSIRQNLEKQYPKYFELIEEEKKRLLWILIDKYAESIKYVRKY